MFEVELEIVLKVAAEVQLSMLHSHLLILDTERLYRLYLITQFVNICMSVS